MADIVRGRIIDAETGEGVPFAALEWLPFEGDVDVAGGMNKHLADSLGRFQFYAPGNGFLIVSMLGYENAGKDVSVFSESRRDTVMVGDIRLKPTETLLKMVEVNARARRFTMNGDTIVFHPEAFHLEEGARLEELIRKLPGVTMDEKGLSWNGRPLRIIMNGKDLFGGNAIISQLPAEAVENIKAYNKASEFSQRTGKDDGGEDMVLDLNIKPGFLDRLYGDAKAIYQTPKNYEGEVVANRLSDHDPLMVYANANNRNRYIQHTMQSQWGGTRREGFGLGQYGALGYQHNWGRQDGGQALRSFATVTGAIDHNDHWGTNYNDTRNYFPGEVSNRRFTASHYHNHKLAPRIESALRWQKDSRNTFSLSLNGEYGRQRGSQDEQTRQTQLTDSMAMTDAVMMRSHTQGATVAELVGVETKAGWIHYMPEGKGSAEVAANWNLADNDGTGLTVREVAYPTQADMDYTLRQDYQSHTSTTGTGISAEVKRWFTDRVLLAGKYAFDIKRNHDRRDMQADLVHSAENSYDDCLHRTAHTAVLQSTVNLRPFQFIPKLQYTFLHEREDYRRGLLDTLARRDVQWLEPSIQVKWKMKDGTVLDLNYGMSTSQPQLLQTIAFRDATNPLFVTEGNPGLCNRHAHRLGINYEMTRPATGLLLQAWGRFTATDREHSTFLLYDAGRGSYLARQENARGSRSLDLTVIYGQGLGVLYWTGNSSFAYRQSYAPLMQVVGTAARTENRQRQTHWTNQLELGADWEWVQIAASANIDANLLTNSAADVQNTTLWNNSFGIRAELRKGKFTVKTSLSEQMRRGYLTRGMNTDHLIWNASASWRCLRGKGKLELEVNDILNNADTFSSTETANQQVSTWSEHMHHFAALSFSYHLDPKEKK